jgi:hypothetical protein
MAMKLGGAHFDTDRSRRGDDSLALVDAPMATGASEAGGQRCC